jgi:GNAT superfamily N-acetyltransferase
MQSVIFRDHTPADDALACELYNQLHPESPDVPKRMREGMDTTPTEHVIGRWVGHRGEDMVLAVRIVREFWTGHLDNCNLVMGFQRSDLAGATEGLEFALTQARKAGCKSMVTWMRDDWPEVLALLPFQQAEVTQTNAESFLRLEDFDEAAWRDRVSDTWQKFEILSCEELLKNDDGAMRHELWQLEQDIMRDVPLPTPYQEIPFDLFNMHLDQSRTDWPTMFFARVDGELAGMSCVYQNEADESRWDTGLTGVRRAYRRQGLAMALKVFAMTDVKRRGGVILGTDNEEANPMWDLNQQLGFRHHYNWLGYTFVWSE